MSSQRLEVLRTLAKGETLTPLQAFTRFNCLTLSQRVTELRDQGWPVKSKLVRVGAKLVAQYSLPRAQRARAMVAP